MISTLLLDPGLVLWSNNVHYSSVQLSRPLGHFEIHLTCWNQNEWNTSYNHTARHVDLIKKRGDEGPLSGDVGHGGKGRHTLMTRCWQLRSWPSFWPPAATPAAHRKWTPADVCRTTTLLKQTVCYVVLKMVQGFEGYDQMSAELLAHFVCNSHQLLRG